MYWIKTENTNCPSCNTQTIHIVTEASFLASLQSNGFSLNYMQPCTSSRGISVSTISSGNTQHRDLSHHWLIQWAPLPQTHRVLLLLLSITFLGVCAVLGWLDPGQQPCCWLLIPPQWDRGENRKKKKKLTGLRYRQFNRGRKGKIPHKWRKETLTTSHRVTNATSSSLLISKNQTSWKQIAHPFFFIYLCFSFWAIHSTAHPTDQFGSILSLCPCTASCSLPCLLAGQGGWKKALMYSPETAKTLLCYQHCCSHKPQALRMWWKLTPKPGIGMCSHWHCANRGNQIPQRWA